MPKTPRSPLRWKAFPSTNLKRIRQIDRTQITTTNFTREPLITDLPIANFVRSCVEVTSCGVLLVVVISVECAVTSKHASSSSSPD